MPIDPGALAGAGAAGDHDHAGVRYSTLISCRFEWTTTETTSWVWPTICAIDNHIWDIPHHGLTTDEAMTLADNELLSGEPDRIWRVAFLSNTGVPNTALSSEYTSGDTGLMNRHGVAGQWVLEVCGMESTPVSDGARSGHSDTSPNTGTRCGTPRSVSQTAPPTLKRSPVSSRPGEQAGPQIEQSYQGRVCRRPMSTARV